MEWVSTRARSAGPGSRCDCRGYLTDVGCRDATPSFALLDVQGPVIVTYVYQLIDGEVSISPNPRAE